MRLIFIMVDGFGIPPEGYFNEVYNRYCHEPFQCLLDEWAIPLDATLDHPGTPQSATGQSSLFCGLNTSRLLGMHLQGFPNKQLRRIIREQNMFKALGQLGKSVTFANAYVNYSLEELERVGMRSVTTVMTQHELGKVRTGRDLLAGNAVFHDMTRQLVHYDIRRRHKPHSPPISNHSRQIPEITPDQAALDLRNISRQYDFTLYEYFLTDRAGHKRQEELLVKSLGDFSRFVANLADNLDNDQLLIVTSDHGNCEDISIKSHTTNPVPLLVYSRDNLCPLPSIQSITEVYDWIINIMKNEE